MHMMPDFDEMDNELEEDEDDIVGTDQRGKSIRSSQSSISFPPKVKKPKTKGPMDTFFTPNPDVVQNLLFLFLLSLGMKPPSYHETRVTYLKKELANTNDLMKDHRENWLKYGCSIMADGWTEGKGRTLIIFLVNCPKGNMFIESIDASSYSKDGKRLFELLDKLVDTEKKPPMGYIYEAMDRAKESISSSFGGKEEKYEDIFKIIDHRWDIQLHRPLHAAGYFLNPEFFYANPNVAQDDEIMTGCIVAYQSWCQVLRIAPLMCLARLIDEMRRFVRLARLMRLVHLARLMRFSYLIVVNAVKFNEYASVVVSAGYDRSVRAWDCRSHSTEPIQIVDTFLDSVMSVCLTKSEIIAGSVDGTVRTFDIRIGREISDDLGQPVNCISLSNDGNCILASCLDSTLRLLDRSTGELLQEYKGHTCKSYKMDCCLTNSDAHITGGSEDGFIYYWDLVDASVVSSFRAHTSVKAGCDWRRTIGDWFCVTMRMASHMASACDGSTCAVLCGGSRNRHDVKGCGGGQEFANFVIVGKVKSVRVKVNASTIDIGTLAEMGIVPGACTIDSLRYKGVLIALATLRSVANITYE
ncbi:transducin/WD40 repeat-like superfamily protein [Actinidia rufa]|uniref:Transducin/WD40 repeat-like superfamily protein n=2 Tax=Magnoliopsida TaxID=3398 RepID=A0A7J0GVV6_9ERIC|nr:transducin/WD40 repeat-like superfamily protein [Actinidia rufa]